MTNVNRIKEELSNIVEEIIDAQIKMSFTRKKLDWSLFPGVDRSKLVQPVVDWEAVLTKKADHDLDQVAVFNSLVREYVNSKILENLSGLYDGYLKTIPLGGYVNEIKKHIRKDYLDAVCNNIYKDYKDASWKDPEFSSFHAFNHSPRRYLMERLLRRGDPEITKSFTTRIDKLFGITEASTADFSKFLEEIVGDSILNLEFVNFFDRASRLAEILKQPAQLNLNYKTAIIKRLKWIGNYKTLKYMEKAYSSSLTD